MEVRLFYDRAYSMKVIRRVSDKKDVKVLILNQQSMQEGLLGAYVKRKSYERFTQLFSLIATGLLVVVYKVFVFFLCMCSVINYAV